MTIILTIYITGLITTAAWAWILDEYRCWTDVLVLLAWPLGILACVAMKLLEPKGGGR